MIEEREVHVYVAASIDVVVTRENGICKFRPVSEVAEKIFAEIKCAKFGKSLIIAEIMYQSTFDHLVMNKRLCIAEEKTKHQNQN